VVSGDEAEEEEIIRRPRLDPNQSSVSEFFTPVKSFSKTPLKSVFFKNNLQFHIGSTPKGSKRLVLPIADKETILSTLGVSEETRNSELLVPSSGIFGGDGTEIRAAMDGEPKKFHMVNPLDFLQEEMKDNAKQWQLMAVISYYKARNKNRRSKFGQSSKLKFKMSNAAKVLNPDLKVTPPKLPKESWNVLEVKRWENDMIKFMNKHCFSGASIWQSGDRDFPFSPEPSQLALYIDNNMEVGDSLSFDEINLMEFKWAMEHLSLSSENHSHANVLIWIDSMLREASADVPLLSNTIESVEFLDIAGLNQARLEFYKELDDYMRIDPGRAFSLEEMKLDQTFREFLARETNIISNLAKINAQPRVEIQKYILAEAFCLLYGIKYRIKIQHYIYDKTKGFADFAYILNEIIKQEGLDPKFNKRLTQADIDKAMEYRVNPIEELERYAVPVNEPTGTKKVKVDNVANHTKAASKTGKGGTTEVNQGLKKRKQDTNDDVTTEMEQLKKRAYKALASDPEITEEMLQETESIIDAVAQFNVSKAKGAQKRFVNKIKKQLQKGRTYSQNNPKNNDNK
jgi:hypothetical protein